MKLTHILCIALIFCALFASASGDFMVKKKVNATKTTTDKKFWGQQTLANMGNSMSNGMTAAKTSASAGMATAGTKMNMLKGRVTASALNYYVCELKAATSNPALSHVTVIKQDLKGMGLMGAKQPRWNIEKTKFGAGDWVERPCTDPVSCAQFNFCMASAQVMCLDPNAVTQSTVCSPPLTLAQLQTYSNPVIAAAYKGAM